MNLNNKYLSWAINIGYFVGLIISIEGGFYGKYLIITTLLMIIVFWKPLIEFMKAFSVIYTNWCDATAKKTIGRFNPYISDEEKKGRKSI
jgi:uncharacterized membrane protein